MSRLAEATRVAARRAFGFALAASVASATVLAGPAAAQPRGPAEGAAPGAESPVAGERALLGRLLAPCCEAQTLDVHASPLAVELRAEIRRRLIAGETPEAIEADLVSRFGPRIRAVAPGDPSGSVALGLALLAIGAGGGLFLVVRRWTRRPGAPALEPAAAARDAWDERLDDELRDLG